MFDFDQQVRGLHGVVAAEQQELTADQKQRDAFETHRHRVFALSYYMTANEQEAEHILTQTFVRAFRTAPAPDAQGVDQALVKELTRRFSLAPSAQAVPERNAHLGQSQVRRTDLEEALGALPALEKLVFLLRDVENYPPDTIAKLLRCDLAEINQTTLSARIRMRNELSRLRGRSARVPDQSWSSEPVLHEA